jgi:hypothetical protein
VFIKTDKGSNKENYTRQNAKDSTFCVTLHQGKISRIITVEPDHDNDTSQRHGRNETTQSWELSGNLAAEYNDTNSGEQFNQKVHRNTSVKKERVTCLEHLKYKDKRSVLQTINSFITVISARKNSPYALWKKMVLLPRGQK